MRVTCPAGTDSRAYALCRPRFWGKISGWTGQRSSRWTFEQVQEVDVLAVGEVNLFPQQRVRQLVGKLRNQLVEVPEIEHWTLEHGQVVDGLNSPFVEQQQ